MTWLFLKLCSFQTYNKFAMNCFNKTFYRVQSNYAIHGYKFTNKICLRQDMTKYNIASLLYHISRYLKCLGFHTATYFSIAWVVLKWCNESMKYFEFCNLLIVEEPEVAWVVAVRVEVIVPRVLTPSETGVAVAVLVCHRGTRRLQPQPRRWPWKHHIISSAYDPFLLRFVAL